MVWIENRSKNIYQSILLGIDEGKGFFKSIR